MDYHTRVLNGDTWREHEDVVHILAQAYSVDFWSQTWRELLAVRDPHGRIVQQFGTTDESGDVCQDTQTLLDQARISAQDAAWPLELWRRAGEGGLHDADGRPVTPYWSLDDSRAELSKFVAPLVEGGCAGEIMVLFSEQDEVAGFSAFTCLPGEAGRRVAHLRYPVDRLHMPVDNDEATATNLERILGDLFPGEGRFGIFLDHAISPKHRGGGLGSRLFDERLTRLLEMGAQVIFGRTQVTARPQYEGNYLKRGLRPFAGDPTSRDKHYFCARAQELTPRKR